MFELNLQDFSLFPLPSSVQHWVVWLSRLYSLPSGIYLYVVIRSPLSFSRQNNPVLSAKNLSDSCMQESLIPEFSQPFSGLALVDPCLSCTGEPWAGCRAPAMVSAALSRGNSRLPSPAGNVLPSGGHWLHCGGTPQNLWGSFSRTSGWLIPTSLTVVLSKLACCSSLSWMWLVKPVLLICSSRLSSSLNFFSSFPQNTSQAFCFQLLWFTTPTSLTHNLLQQSFEVLIL